MGPLKPSLSPKASRNTGISSTGHIVNVLLDAELLSDGEHDTSLVHIVFDDDIGFLEVARPHDVRVNVEDRRTLVAEVPAVPVVLAGDVVFGRTDGFGSAHLGFRKWRAGSR